MIHEIIGGIACVLAVTGVLLNNRKMMGCFYFWIASNSLSGLLHWDAGQYTLCARDMIFFALAVVGVWKWRNEKNKIEVLEAENKRLAEFARGVIDDYCWDLCVIPDGGSIQDFAEKLGLIESHPATTEDAIDFPDFEVGDPIYKFSGILKEK
jgi:hypothetical protein